MNGRGWIYYNNAIVPTTAPHEQPHTALIEDKSIWSICEGGKPLLVRWTTDFDCGYETDWWYVIKDTPFDIFALKAKRRYEIKKGQKNFLVKEICPGDFVEELYKVQVEAYSAYPEKYRPKVDKNRWQASILEQSETPGVTYLAAFSKESGELSGYAKLTRDGRCIHFESLKTRPAFENLSVNAALVMRIMELYDEDLRSGAYICDGSRNIRHETAFQAYLEKYFGFRKAYCRLHVVYNPTCRVMVRVLYAFRKLLKKMDGISVVHKLNGVLLMEEILRKQNKRGTHG